MIISMSLVFFTVLIGLIIMIGYSWGYEDGSKFKR